MDVYDDVEETIAYFHNNQTFPEFIALVCNMDLRKIKTLIFEPFGITPTTQLLEYLCSSGNIERIVVSKILGPRELGNTINLPMLPYPHLRKLKYYNNKVFKMNDEYYNSPKKTLVKFLLNYVGCLTNLKDFRDIISKYTWGTSIGVTVKDVMSKDFDTTPNINDYIRRSSVHNLKPKQCLIASFYQPIEEFFYMVNSLNVNKIRYIDMAEESCQLTTEFLKYLCSGGNVEQIYLGEEKHTITILPVKYLHKLKSLFICEDTRILITDFTLCSMSNLESLTLSHNNTITIEGIHCLPKLKVCMLYSNTFINPEDKSLIKYNPLLLNILVAENNLD